MRRWVVHLEAASERDDDLRRFACRAENLIGMLELVDPPIAHY